MKHQRTILTRLRDIVPLRPLSETDAEWVAEHQANLLLKLSGVTGPAVSEEIISELPRVLVQRVGALGSSGRTEWGAGLWHVLINRSEPLVRQRFSLAHEFKHILDHPFVDFLYPPRSPHSTKSRAEYVCDHFAACLLMPKAWVTTAYCNDGIQDLRTLARRFGVSQSAMQIRLVNLGLAQPVPRCDPYLRTANELIKAAA